MEILGVVFSVVAVVLIVLAVVIGCLAAVALVILGVVSSSVLVGLSAGHATAGLRAFLIQAGIVTGLPAGIVCVWLGKRFFEAAGNELPLLASGALGGALAGVIVALLITSAWTRLNEWTSTRAEALRVARQPVTIGHGPAGR